MRKGFNELQNYEMGILPWLQTFTFFWATGLQLHEAKHKEVGWKYLKRKLDHTDNVQLGLLWACGLETSTRARQQFSTLAASSCCLSWYKFCFSSSSFFAVTLEIIASVSSLAVFDSALLRFAVLVSAGALLWVRVIFASAMWKKCQSLWCSCCRWFPNPYKGF